MIHRGEERRMLSSFWGCGEPAPPEGCMSAVWGDVGGWGGEGGGGEACGGSS